jgi:hypothetical protein
MEKFKRSYFGFKSLIIISIAAFFIKCDSAELMEPISADKCYEGEVIRGFCPSYLVVNVTNGQIGQKWTFNGKKYNNAILIKNASISDEELNTFHETRNGKIYFVVDIEATTKNENCQLEKTCLQWAEDTSAPGKSVCIKFMSNQKCNNL